MTPFNRQQVLGAAEAYEQATKTARAKMQTVQANAVKGDTNALLHLWDVQEEFRAVRDEAQKIYFEKIGE